MKPIASRSGEHESRLRPFPVARPQQPGRWTAEAHQLPTALLTVVKVSNGRTRGSRFSSCQISLLPRSAGATPGIATGSLSHINASFPAPLGADPFDLLQARINVHIWFTCLHYDHASTSLLRLRETISRRMRPFLRRESRCELRATQKRASDQHHCRFR